MINGTTHPLIVGLMISIFGASIGFSSSQLFIVGEVKLNTQAVIDIKGAEADLKVTEAKDIANLTILFTKNLELNRELIEIVRVQNDLLARKK